MYLKGVMIENIRSLRHFSWKLESNELAGWHVFIGDNGSGKSSFLRATALSLIGPNEVGALRQDWSDWLRKREGIGTVASYIIPDPIIDIYPEEFDRRETDVVLAHVFLVRSEDSVIHMTLSTVGEQLKISETDDANAPLIARFREISKDFGENVVEATLRGSARGWFSASYGPFRRFAGGSPDSEKLYASNPKLARHLSVFGEDIALTEALAWLQRLQFQALEERQKNPNVESSETVLLHTLKSFINQPDFLPHGVRLHDINSRAVIFMDGNDAEISVMELSDGYRSILSMTFELIRQLALEYGADKVFDRENPTQVAVPGVVLIDEVDAHLHPTWQRRIGLWFRKHFPKIQFIVTTHSPLVCQAADVGTVWRLPTPGTDDKGGQVQGQELERLLYGNILDAYGTGLFGPGITRSDESERKLDRLAELNVKETRGELTAAERAEQQELRSLLPTDANAGAPTPKPGGQAVGLATPLSSAPHGQKRTKNSGARRAKA